MGSTWQQTSCPDEWHADSDPAVVSLWPQHHINLYCVVPFSYGHASAHTTLKVLVTHNHHPWAQDELQKIFPCAQTFDAYVVSEETFQRVLDTWIQSDRHPYAFNFREEQVPFGVPSVPFHTHVEDASGFLTLLLRYCAHRHITDIHFEPRQHRTKIRYRLDGLLQDFGELSPLSWSWINRRLKVMASMDSTEYQIPQSGRLTFPFDEKNIDCRLATHPTLHGEKLTIRMLPQNQKAHDLSALGFTDEQQQQLLSMLSHPEGSILVCGPTGSGKTTTLYSLLKNMDAHTRNIMTLEDPVEYVMDELTQTDLSHKKGLTFADGVRSLLRQDPDVMLIGEVRDEETAQMMMRASMTGHQMLTTLHVHSVPNVWTRFADLGVTSTALQDNLVGMIHQRLVRKLCIYCKHHDHEGAGCTHCHFTKYRGRTVLAEVLTKPDLHREKQTTSTHPMRNLWKSAHLKIQKQEVSLKECERVLGPHLEF